jgi:YbgC/YbaW family acyl-CoA thioester hydrolase
MSTVPPQFTYERQVQFSETDMAGIVHFANYYRFMEEAEHAFFRSLGLKIMDANPDGSFVGWPRVRAACSFEAPAHYGDQLQIDINVQRRGVKSLTLTYRIRRGDAVLANGEMKTVLCRKVAGQAMQSIEIPESVAAVLVEQPVPRLGTADG